MLKIFYGDDRVKANQEIKKLLGEKYEIIDGQDLAENDLLNIFHGASLFGDKRNILLRDLSENKSAWAKLPEFLDTSHNIILLELKLDKRSTTYKALKDKIEFKEFKLPLAQDFGLVFDIYRTAKKDGKKAVNMLEKVKLTEDPIQFTGLLISQAIKDFNAAQNSQSAKKVLKALAHLDINMKSTKIDPWLLVESFLLELSSLV